MFDFDRPAFLFLLPAAVLVSVSETTSLAQWSARARQCTGLRQLILALL
jgi:hypothetical protein